MAIRKQTRSTKQNISEAHKKWRLMSSHQHAKSQPTKAHQAAYMHNVGKAQAARKKQSKDEELQENVTDIDTDSLGT